MNSDAQRALRGRTWAGLPLTLLCASSAAFGQDVEPRRWAHLPVDSNLVGLAYAHTRGDVAFDPVLDISEASVDSDLLVASFLHTFAVGDRTGRLDVIVPVQSTTWEGLLAGTPASKSLTGLSDPWLRLSLNLLGAPALKGVEYMQYRGAHPVETVVGVALGVGLPLGEYDSAQLLNLGSNRFTFRPQVGVVHTRGPWSFELTGSTYL